MTVQIAFTLPEVISAEPEVLGRADPLNINGLAGTLSTPTENNEWGASEYWHAIDWDDIDYIPDLQGPEELVPQLSDASIGWGRLTTRPEYGVEINALLLSLDTTAEVVKADINGWFGKVANWLQAYTLQVLTTQSADEELVSRLIQAWRIVDGEVERVKWIRREEARHDVPAWTLVTVPTWIASVRHASAGSELPLNWQLLVDSLRALYASYPRRAAIEAFTALEVTLREAIRQRVGQCGDPTVASVIINQRNTLGPLIEQAEGLEIQLPDGLTPSIVALRNRAIHRGESPSQGDAPRVWQIAHALAQLHSPLPTL